MQHANSEFAAVFGRKLLFAVVVLLTAPITAKASGPRWVSGPPYFTNWRVMISWYTNHPRYFTDSGDLSVSVSHADADAMVARAAAVWNVPTASLVLNQGGVLNEHVSGANVYASANGPVFPADVQSTNYSAKQIAVIYDSDGSVTDTLLGSGGSDPTGCLQSGVTESVDSITPQGQIQHAILVLNGRCTGPQPEKQLQMQYQLERAFGRILGLGWSQTNDNVFTGSPTPTQEQALNWPIMHPIDIICGPYTYQCFPQPFTLRPDDISSLEQLYFIPQGQAAPDKTPSWSNAGGAYGHISFADGQGMEGVNVVVRRRPPFFATSEGWQTVSAVPGYAFRGVAPTSMFALGSTASASMGVAEGDREGYWRIQSIPLMPSTGWTDLVVAIEPVNPLYTGPYAIGPQAGNTISPSGTSPSQISQYLAPGRDNQIDFTPSGGVDTCPAQNDGYDAAPAALPQSGWWTGTLCGYQHQAWTNVPVKANRTLTVEVTALDEQGMVSMTKAMPTIGVWKAADPTGTVPTVAVSATAFNSLSVGMTTLRFTSATATTYRVAIADQRGAGRPDFAYQARALYADAVSPANVGSDGGTVTITGMGFRQGNTVLVNGIAADVVSWTPIAIVATVPSLHTLGLNRATQANITVRDISTGGSSVMTAALSYAQPVEALHLLSAPAGVVPAGAAAPVSFSVKAIAPDGFTPVVGEAVRFTAAGTAAALSPCGSSTCTVMTNAAGIASATVTPFSQGSVTLTATGRSGTATASFTATAANDVLDLVSAPVGVVAAGTASSTAFTVRVLAGDSVTPAAGVSVIFSAAGAAVQFGACGAAVCTLTTDSQGVASSSVMPTVPGAVTLSGISSAGAVTASFSAVQQVRSIRITEPALYIAEGASFAWQPQVTLSDNLAATSNLSVSWQSTPGISLLGAASISDTHGVAEGDATAGPLAASASAQISACAWGSICAPLIVHGVSADELSLMLISGVAQSVSSSDNLTPATVKVIDAHGNPVAGASVRIEQTVSEWQTPCPGSGRCPVATVLASSSSSAVSDQNGRVTITPSQTDNGTPAITRIAVIVGSQGFATLSLERHP